MKTKLNYLLLCCIGFLTISCSAEMNGGNKEENKKPKISLSPSSLEFTADGGERDVTLAANCEWTAEFPQGTHFSPSSGKGDAKVTIAVDPNTEYRDRDFSILVRSREEPSAEATLKITQQASPKPFFDCDMTAETVFTYNAEERTFHCTTNIPETDLNISVDQSWCRASCDGKLLKVTVEDFLGGSKREAPRKAQITVRDRTDTLQRYAVIQENIVTIEVNRNDIRLNPDGDSLEIKVAANCHSWSVTTDAKWFTVKKKDPKTLLLTAQPRGAEILTPRIGDFTISADSGSAQCSFRVMDADANLSSEDFRYGDHTGWD